MSALYMGKIKPTCSQQQKYEYSGRRATSQTLSKTSDDDSYLTTLRILHGVVRVAGWEPEEFGRVSDRFSLLR